MFDVGIKSRGTGIEEDGPFDKFYPNSEEFTTGKEDLDLPQTLLTHPALT
jgi:hypothetical protein